MTVAVPEPRQLRPWRAACRQEAAAQAARDARAGWKSVGVAGVTPFDHRWEHVQSVVRLARWLAAELTADLDIVEASAWLHDIRKSERDHGNAGAEAAEQLLAQTDFPAHKVEAVVSAIRQHVGLHRRPGAPPMEPLESAILWDADKLSKLGAQAVALNLCAFYGAGDGLPERRQAAEDFAFGALKKTVISMNTEPARRLAAERYAAMLAVLEAWEREERFEEQWDEYEN